MWSGERLVARRGALATWLGWRRRRLGGGKTGADIARRHRGGGGWRSALTTARRGGARSGGAQPAWLALLAAACGLHDRAVEGVGIRRQRLKTGDGAGGGAKRLSARRP